MPKYQLCWQVFCRRSVSATRLGTCSENNSMRIIEKRHCSSKASSVSADEMNKFRSFSSKWWTPGGEYEALRTLNDLRVPTVMKLLPQKKPIGNEYMPLENYKILDVGCGGGILAEPLSRLGGDVLGIDPLPESIDTAKKHAAIDPDLKTLEYRCISVEEMYPEYESSFDIVIASEVVEHVDDPQTFLYNCCSLIKPGGLILLTTINRTLLSALLAKYAAEYLLRIVPQGTHEIEKFITPEELTRILRKSDMVEINYKGMIMNPITLHWSWTDMLSMNYMCYARKPN